MNIREWSRQGNIFGDHHAQVPVVDVCDGYWRIYYSYRIDGKSVPYYIDVDPADPSKILLKSDKQLLQLGELGRFDWAGIMPTDIINVGSKKYMYYIGWSVRKDVPYHNSLGLAISEDNGDTWHKFSDGPVFGTSYKEPGYVGTAEVVLVDDTYYMYYLSCRDWIIVENHPEPIYDIKIALSKNAIDWDPLDRVAIGLEKGQGGISKATVIKYENRYYMWYSARSESNYRLNPNHGYRIYCAVSDDLLNWTKLNRHGLDINLSSDWERIMVEYPDVFIHNNRVHMFYNGDGFGRTGIGYANMDITLLKYD
ncbi:MAG: hypothetical protein RI985_638 [Chloroflexota bacterium]|jgi:predicted GH43/DUF377 family glycosyl hydrolase